MGCTCKKSFRLSPMCLSRRQCIRLRNIAPAGYILFSRDNASLYVFKGSYVIRGILLSLLDFGCLELDAIQSSPVSNFLYALFTRYKTSLLCSLSILHRSTLTSASRRAESTVCITVSTVPSLLPHGLIRLSEPSVLVNENPRCPLEQVSS